MRKIALMLLSIVLLSTYVVEAQVKAISGTVTSSEDGMGIPGVSVSVKGTTIGTVTNVDGVFNLDVPNDAKTLIFSFVGMRTEEVLLDGNSTFNVQLRPDVLNVDEVVVVGYGTGKKIGSVVGSLSTVSEGTIKDKPTANVFDALQGKVAGIQSYSSSGEPTQLSSIRLHGVGSLGGSTEPLYVVDGMPVPSTALLALNTGDFASITVLKDASATSIYGSRAANGVIYITTKNGKRGDKAKITVNAQYGVSTLANTDFFNSVMNTKELTDFWVATGYRTQEQVDNLLSENINPNTSEPYDTKWYEFYYKDYAPTAQTNISITGGSDKTRYFVSGGTYYQDGLAQRSEYERFTFRSNVDSKVNDWFSFGANVSGSTDSRQLNPYGTNNTNRGLAILAQPFYSPYDENGERFEGRIPGWSRYDPLYLAEKNPAETNRLQFSGLGFIQLNPIRGLTIRSQAGINGYHDRIHSKRYPSYVGELGNGSASEGFAESITRTITNTAEYKFNVKEDHAFTLLVGQEGTDFKYESFSASSTGQTDDRLMLLTAGPDNRDVGHGRTEYAYLSYFGRLEYNFSNKYFFDFSLRRDASSRFGANKRNATFYATGIMWDVKKETFLESFDLLSSLTLKASYGTSGNSSQSSDPTVGNYEPLALVGTSQFANQPAWLISSPGNPDLGWEEQALLTIGTKFSILEERFRFNIEYYNRSTKNQLIDVPYPYTAGFSSVLSNVGTIENRGIDVQFDFDIVNRGDLYVTPYFNIGYNKNEITELFQGKDYWIIPNTGVSWAVGKPVSFFYPVFAGVDPADGAPMWYVPGEDISTLTKEEVTKNFSSADLQQSTGINRYAPTAGGFGVSAGWKGFYLQADFSFVLGKYLISNDGYFYENPNVFAGYNQSKKVLDYWKKPGDITQYPGYDVAQFTQFDSRLVEDASFMRLKNLTIGYSIPDEVVKKTGFLSGARIFATGRNIWTVTDYTGPDPEVDSNLTLGTNPNTKQYTLGVEITF